MSAARLQVLVIAEAANPEWTSVPLVGWSIARALHSVVDVHLVTHVRNEAAIRRTHAEFASVTFIDSEAAARPLWKLASLLRGGSGKGWTVVTALGALSYYYFEHLVWKRFGSRLVSRNFDLVHRVTPLSPTTPSLLAGKCRAAGVPFVLGPLNGGVPWPSQFRQARHQEREWLSYLRGAYKLLPGYRSTLKHAALIIAGSRATQAALPAGVAPKVAYVPENAVDLARFPPKADRGDSSDGPLRVCFVGRLVPYKGPDMLLEACLTLLAAGRVRLDFIGDGPLADALKQQAARGGVDSAVSFHGWLPHERVHEVLGRAHVLGFPSVREFGGGVVLEAMALGVVPIVVDYAGPGELVDEQTGYKIPLGTRDRIVEGLRGLLETLARDRGALRAPSQAARQRIDELFTWEAKAAQLRELYDCALHASRPVPQFGFLKNHRGQPMNNSQTPAKASIGS